MNQSLLKKSTRIGLDLIIKSLKLLMVLKTNKNFFKFSVKQKSLVNIQNHFSKTQYSKISVKYKKNLDKKTGKINIDPQLYQNHKDETSYIPVTFSRNTGNPGG